MGSTGSKTKKSRLVANEPPERKTVTDEYGRTYPVVDTVDDVPDGWHLWTSGSWVSGSEFGKGYAVFARVDSDYHVDVDNGMVVEMPARDINLIRRAYTSSIEVVRSGRKPMSTLAEEYIRRYSKSKSLYVQHKIKHFKDVIPVLKKYGL